MPPAEPSFPVLSSPSNSLFDDSDGEYGAVQTSEESQSNQSVTQTTIDLTADDEEEEEQNEDEQPHGRISIRMPNNRAPPFPARAIDTEHEVIDLLDSSDDEGQLPTNHDRERRADGGDGEGEGRQHLPRLSIISSSPEIEVTGSRRLPPRPVLVPNGEINRTLPPPNVPPLTRSNAQSFASVLHRIGDQALPGNTQSIYERFVPQFHQWNPRTAITNILPGVFGGRHPPPFTYPDAGPFDDPGLVDDDLYDMQMNYVTQGFAFGDRAPQQETDSYKAPAQPPRGFTRNLDDKDVLLCAGCDEELGRGEEESTSAQIWASAKCGHVSCLCLEVCGRPFTNVRTGVLWRVCSEKIRH